jgi:glycolate oxidase FAD binding subunit
MKPLTPNNTYEVAAGVADAAAARTPLCITGHSSKASLGRPCEGVRRLDLSALSGVTFYEPEELVLTTLAATPIDDIERLLASHGQELAFEPMSFNALYGTGAGTLGGCFMTNLSGPRRIKAGAARDHVLGVKAVSGRGEMFKAGGRVVKNVTGYDLSRGLAGSFGTLAIATEITVKVLPRAETAVTLILTGLNPSDAIAALCTAMGAPVDVSGAAHLPAFAAAALSFTTSITALRLEGIAPSVAERFDRLAATLRIHGPSERLEGEASAFLWRAIRDLTPLAGLREHAIWKVSVAPTAGPKVVDAVTRDCTAEVMFDWSGGLVWLAIEPCPDAAAPIIRKAIMENGGGHATLVRAPDEVRSRIPVFEPQASALAKLSRRLKREFDPYGILEPGRMVRGI